MKLASLKITNNTVLLTVLFVYATALSPFLDDAFRNKLVIAVSILAFPFLFLRQSRAGRDILLVALAMLYPLLITLLTGTMRDVQTLSYTALFATGYLAVAGALKNRHVTLEGVEAFLATLIKLYAVVSVAQLVASMTGLPVPNQLATKGLWSYNSLATEPSYVARVVSLTMLAYLIIGRTRARPEGLIAMIRSRKWVFLAFGVSVFLSGSALALVAAPVAILLSLSTAWTIPISVSLMVFWPTLFLIDSEPLQRLLVFFGALPSMDLSELTQADSSGAIRVAPLLIYGDQLDIGSLGFWFGEGISSLTRYFEGRIPGLENGIMVGFIPGYTVAFGVLGTSLFLWVFVIRFFNASTAPAIIMLGIFYTLVGWNTQVFWYGLMILRVVYHASKVRSWPRKSRRTSAAPLSFSPHLLRHDRPV